MTLIIKSIYSNILFTDRSVIPYIVLKCGNHIAKEDAVIILIFTHCIQDDFYPVMF